VDRNRSGLGRIPREGHALPLSPGKIDSKTYADFPLADSGTTEFWNIKVTDQAGLKGDFGTEPWQDYQMTMTDKSKVVMLVPARAGGVDRSTGPCEFRQP
jgi:hypothetical protein